MPLVELLSSGVHVFLGTDGPVTNNSLNMREEMKFAALVHKAHRWDPGATDARTVLEIATRDCMGYVLYDLTDIRMMPHHNLIDNLVFSGGRVTHVFVMGNPVMVDGEIITMNEKRIKERFLKICEDIWM